MAVRKAKKVSSSKAKYHHGDLRRELLRFARQQIAQNGAQSITLASLAKLAGVSQPAPYRHFVDRNALLEAVAAEGFEEFDQVLTQACVEGPPNIALESMAHAYMAFGEANTELYRLMFASRLVPDAAPGSLLAKLADKSFDRLRDVVRLVAPAASAYTQALLFWAQLHGLVMLRADGFIDTPLNEQREQLRLWQFRLFGPS